MIPNETARGAATTDRAFARPLRELAAGADKGGTISRVSATDPLGMLGQVLHGQFRVDEVVKEGRRSVLYRGAHLMLEVPIAIKCMKVPDSAQQQFIRRFRHESRLHYKLSQASPHVVRVLAGGTAMASSSDTQLVPFTVLEWLEGESLARGAGDATARAADRPPSERAVRLLDPGAEAFAMAHAHGIVHRESRRRTCSSRGGRAGAPQGPRLRRGQDRERARARSAAGPQTLAPCRSRRPRTPRRSSSTATSADRSVDRRLRGRAHPDGAPARPTRHGPGGPPLALRATDRRTAPGLARWGSRWARAPRALEPGGGARPTERPQEAGEFWGTLKNAMMQDQDARALPATAIAAATADDDDDPASSRPHAGAPVVARRGG